MIQNTKYAFALRNDFPSIAEAGNSSGQISILDSSQRVLYDDT